MEKWIAHVDESKIALYSWPASDLKDLEEGKMPFRVAPALHKEFDKLFQLHYAEELSECPTAVVNPAVVGAVTCYYEKPVPNICCPLPQPRRPHDAVASEVRRAVAKCKREGKKAVLICAGTFLGANCSTRGSKTDTTLMGILGDVSHAFVDLYPLGVTKVAEFDAAGGRAMCQVSASAPATFFVL